jgi:glycosyltransferase involved in cell wall biosynthesis
MVNKMSRINNKKDKIRPLQVSNIEEAISFDKNGDISLDLPEIDVIEFPPVSVITITRNRRDMFSMPILNWIRTIYPEDLIEWLILDDGDEDLSNIFPEDDDKRIRYIKCEKMDIGSKRNMAVSLAKHEYIVHMDDDDYYFPTSVIARIRVMLHYKKQCVYSHNLAVYNILSGESYVKEKYNDVPELSMAYTKTFWESRKFGKAPYESYNLVYKREKDIVKLPFLFNCIACTHNSNYTERFKNILKLSERIKSEPVEDLFSQDFKIILQGVKHRIKV